MAATLSVIDTIKKITNISGQIKWPNDVQVNGKNIRNTNRIRIIYN